jgi:hypothetical protein
MENKLVSAVRTVGQLLLSRPTTGALCRNASGQSVDINSNQASCFCYVGACKLVGNYFFNHDGDDYEESVWEACDKVISREVDGDDWDCAHASTRKRWATKLANYTGEQV